MEKRKLCCRLAALAFAGLLSMSWQAGQARADNGADADIFAVLPDGATGPEGLTIASNGDVYVTTFGINASGPTTGNGKMYVFNKNGHLLRQVTVANSSVNLLGLAFHPTTHQLLVIDLGNANVLKVDPVTGASSVFMTVTGSAGLNALTFDKAGNVYVSDSFQGIVWKTTSSGGAATAWVTDPLLSTTGVPGFGANGLGFNKAGDTLFVANTGNDTVVKIPVSGGNPGTPEVFVNSINGADGLILDEDDNLWVAANQNDQIVIIDKTGKLLGRIGSFNGLMNGKPRGLLFPASPAFTIKRNHGADQGGGGGDNRNDVLVTNLALDLRLVGAAQSPDSQWAAQVTRYTISRLKARIPRLHD